MHRYVVLILVIVLIAAFFWLRSQSETTVVSVPGAPTQTFQVESPEQTVEQVPALPEPSDANEPLLERPLRVVGSSWEAMAPCHVAKGTQSGSDLFADAGVPVELLHLRSTQMLEEALARGGEAPQGADVAVLPLPTLVASYERLQALELQVFLVVAMSNGREGLAAAPGNGLLVSPLGGRQKEVRLVANPGSVEAFFSLFMLNAAGAPIAQVRMDSPDAATGSLAPFAAFSKATWNKEDTSRRVLLTTADATDLIPIVAVAPKGFVVKHTDALVAWSRAWVRGVKAMQNDIPSAARSIAKIKGAPSEAELLHAFGSIRLATLRDNARLAGLSGRGAVTLEELFRRTWSIWRETGILSIPAPQSAPLANEVIARLVHTASAEDLAKPVEAKWRCNGKPLLVNRRPKGPVAKLDDSILIGEVGVFAGVFSRSCLELSVRGSPRRTRKAKQRAVERFDLHADRIKPGEVDLAGSPAAIEIFAAP